MRLQGKTVVMLVTDGVDRQEFEQLKTGFEEEQAVVLVTSPQEYLVVETVENGRRGRDILVDLPFELVSTHQFDGLIIPDGILSIELLKKDQRVLRLLADFHQRGLPIFASGSAVELLYESRVLSQQVLVREGTPMTSFMDQAVGVLLDFSPSLPLYRRAIPS